MVGGHGKAPMVSYVFGISEGIQNWSTLSSYPER